MNRRLASSANEAAEEFAGLPFLRGAIDRLARQATEKDPQWSLVCHRAGSRKDRVKQQDDPGGKPHECKCEEKLVTVDFVGELGDPFLVFRVQRTSLSLWWKPAATAPPQRSQRRARDAMLQRQPVC
jgi:hypothetical protein